MIPDCISFNAIPHTTRIFSDFLSYSPEIRSFTLTQPDAAHIAAFAKSVSRDMVRQVRVADVLEKQNRTWEPQRRRCGTSSGFAMAGLLWLQVSR